MRTRSMFAIALLVLPAALEAQRIPTPRIRDRGPVRPAPLPPTARPIAREMVYVRLPFTAESYPLIGYYNAPGLGSRLDNFTVGGTGQRLDLRLTPQVSLTLDLTQSFIGGPAVTQTAELGTRLRPEVRDERKWYPFFDLRAGVLLVSERESRPFDYVDPATTSSFSRSSYGFGGIAGTGVEYALTPRFTLTTTGSLMRTNLSPLFSDQRQVEPVTMTAVRYSIGFRYNPGRWTMPPNLPQRITQ